MRHVGNSSESNLSRTVGVPFYKSGLSITWKGREPGNGVLRDAEYYDYLWNDYIRSLWVASMINRWKLEEEDLRHSREHCIDQYGTNFVREALPKLLRDFDGLSEDDITTLTHDGPDLVPPSPLPSPVRSEDGESDGGSDSETDEDGWETADEN